MRPGVGAQAWALRRAGRQARGREQARGRGRGRKHKQAHARGRRAIAWRRRRLATAARGRAWQRAAWARSLGARVGQGCALGALGLFLARFDSIFFLSQFLDIVREPGS